MSSLRFSPLFAVGWGCVVSVEIAFNCFYVLAITTDILEIDSRRQELTLPPYMPFWFTISTIPLPFRCRRQPSTLQMKPLPGTFLNISHNLPIRTNLILTSNHFSVTYIPTITIRWLVFCDRHSILYLLLLLKLFRL